MDLNLCTTVLIAGLPIITGGIGVIYDWNNGGDRTKIIAIFIVVTSTSTYLSMKVSHDNYSLAT